MELEFGCWFCLAFLLQKEAGGHVCLGMLLSKTICALFMQCHDSWIYLLGRVRPLHFLFVLLGKKHIRSKELFNPFKNIRFTLNMQKVSQQKKKKINQLTHEPDQKSLWENGEKRFLSNNWTASEHRALPLSLQANWKTFDKIRMPMASRKCLHSHSPKSIFHLSRMKS